jgi:hypothetical protein
LADPDNRLVAGEWAQRWNEALERGQDAAARLAALEQRPVPLREEQRQQWLRLGQDLCVVWHHAAAPEALKKRILRTVLHAMVLESPSESCAPLLRRHWQGGVHTEVRVARNTAGKHGRATERDVIEGIRELSNVHRDFTMAATLNRLG